MTQSIDTTGINALCAHFAPDLSTENGQITTTSIQVAQHFGKRHKNVIRDIRSLECSAEFRRLNFELTLQDVPGPNGAMRKEPFYRMTRDGFVFLAMGFTGPEAAQWKEAYIAAFNKMEAALLQRQQAAHLQIQEQLRSQLEQTLQLAQGFKAKCERLTLDYIDLQGDLIGSQGQQIRLLGKVQSLHRVREKRDAKLTIIEMERQGCSRAAIVAATGRNFNHIRQVVWQAREDGTLPPLAKVVSTQTGLFAEAV